MKIPKETSLQSTSTPTLPENENGVFERKECLSIDTKSTLKKHLLNDLDH